MNTGEILDGRYEITAALGAGGMGEIYKATHTLLKAPRVIKVIHSRIAARDDARERFFREARVATKVQHSNVAQLFDFAALPDGSHYMVWEFIDGENLAQRLRTRGTLPPRQALKIAIQALHGLEAIHRAGIIHRDISPENLMITRDDVVKIIDLGVAKIEEPDDVTQTRTGIFVGKLRYAAPEQLGFMAEGEKIDGRADLYALAMVVVELLTGRPPYEAKSPHEYFLHHARELPTSTIEMPPSLPGGEALKEVLQKALSRNREERYGSAQEFANALGGILTMLPDPVTTATMATPLDGDETWRPSQASPLAPFSSTAQTEALTPVPVAPAPPAPAATVLTPLPQGGVPRKSSSGAIAAVVVVVTILLIAGAAFALWPRISMIVLTKQKDEPPAKTTPATPQVKQAQATITVTPPATATSSTLLSSTVTAPPTTTATTPAPPDRTTTTIGEANHHPADVHPRSVPLYIETPGRLRTNERAIDRLHDELHGVTQMAIIGGRDQLTFYRALHRYLPDVDFSDIDAPIVIRWDATTDRLGRDRSDLAGSATITKNGRVIFRYDIPAGAGAEGAANAFAQTLADAMQ